MLWRDNQRLYKHTVSYNIYLNLWIFPTKKCKQMNKIKKELREFPSWLSGNESD